MKFGYDGIYKLHSERVVNRIIECKIMRRSCEKLVLGITVRTLHARRKLLTGKGKGRGQFDLFEVHRIISEASNCISRV